MTSTIKAPVAKAQMLIRKPVEEVFEALVDPVMTSHFWFSKGSGRLVPGKQVRWDWEMYDHHTEVDVKAIEKYRRILVEWNVTKHPSSVEWTFEEKGDKATFVIVKNWGFEGDADKVIADAMDSTGGFSFLLAALKVYLEHGIEPNFVLDHDPDKLVKGWDSRQAA